MVWFRVLCCSLQCLIDQFEVLFRCLQCLVCEFEVLTCMSFSVFQSFAVFVSTALQKFKKLDSQINSNKNTQQLGTQIHRTVNSHVPVLLHHYRVPVYHP